MTFEITSQADAPVTDKKAKAIFSTVCVSCHGSKGEGIKLLNAPSIAGQPEWFLTHQLKKFQSGHRGAFEKSELAKKAEDKNQKGMDSSGALMRNISLTLDPKLIPAISRYIASLPPHPTITKLKGDLENGKYLFMNYCAPCHRYNGQGEMVFKSAPLTSLPDWYIQSSLKKFKEGHRGYHKEDVEGGKMREVTEDLMSVDIKDIVTHIAFLAKKYPPKSRAAQPQKRP